jgi:hypothetical protein
LLRSGFVSGAGLASPESVVLLLLVSFSASASSTCMPLVVAFWGEICGEDSWEEGVGGFCAKICRVGGLACSCSIFEDAGLW